jgi:hypothetical protein
MKGILVISTLILLSIIIITVFPKNEILSQNFPSKILEFNDAKTNVSNSVLLGVTTFGNSEIVIENSKIFRIVTHDNSRVVLKNTNVNYINDRDLKFESLVHELTESEDSDREKILAIYRWVSESIKYGGPIKQNRNASLILKNMKKVIVLHIPLFLQLLHINWVTPTE